jgi:hypothetical protein
MMRGAITKVFICKARDWNPNTTVSDADSSIVQEVFGLAKENLSEAQRGKDAASGERATAPFPRLSPQ